MRRSSLAELPLEVALPLSVFHRCLRDAIIRPRLAPFGYPRRRDFIDDPGPGKRADLVAKAIESMENKLAASDVKATFGDFIRLLQLQKELQIEQPREIKITWIDPSEKKESASEE